MAAFTATPYSFLQTFRNVVWFQIFLGFSNFAIGFEEASQCRLFS